MGINEHWAEIYWTAKCDVPGCDYFADTILYDGTSVCEIHHDFDPPDDGDVPN